MSLKFLWDIQEIVNRQIGYTCPGLKEVDKEKWESPTYLGGQMAKTEIKEEEHQNIWTEL